jgi:hypothetical protein
VCVEVVVVGVIELVIGGGVGSVGGGGVIGVSVVVSTCWCYWW